MKLTMTDTPTTEDVAEIMAGLKAFNRNFVGDNGRKPLAVFITGEHGEKFIWTIMVIPVMRPWK